MPLSYGQFDGQQLECSYHGWKFDAHIRTVPADSFADCRPGAESRPHLRRQLRAAKSTTTTSGFSFPIRRRRGPDSPRRRSLRSPAPRVPTFSEQYKIAHLTADLPCSVDHGIIGLMDPAHGPFVHQAWWWRSRHSIHEKQKNFEPIPHGLPHERAHAQLQQRALQTAAALCGRGVDHDHH